MKKAAQPKQTMAAWKPEGQRLEMAWIGNGTCAYTAFATNSNIPLGTVWVWPTSNSLGDVICEVVDIYVPEKFRRMGIGTYLMKWLLDSYGILRTGTGTKCGGLMLMKAMGWKQNKETGDWYLRGTVRGIKK